MKKNMKIIIALLMLCVVPFLSLFPANEENETGHSQLKKSVVSGFAVVELFTSEGCSSCPPADELIAKLENDTKGEDVYLLVYHVDYWDRLGWKDAFSNSEFTARQQQYADWMKSETIYTPQFVVNGSSEFAGSNANQLYNLVSDGLLTMSTNTLILGAKQNKKLLEVHYKLNNVTKKTTMVLALVQKQASTKIARGENKGRQLKHIQIVNHITSFLLDKNQDSVTITTPENFTASGWELIGFTQDVTSGVIISASKTNFNESYKNHENYNQYPNCHSSCGSVLFGTYHWRDSFLIQKIPIVL